MANTVVFTKNNVISLISLLTFIALFYSCSWMARELEILSHVLKYGIYSLYYLLTVDPSCSAE